MTKGHYKARIGLQKGKLEWTKNNRSKNDCAAVVDIIDEAIKNLEKDISELEEQLAYLEEEHTTVWYVLKHKKTKKYLGEDLSETESILDAFHLKESEIDRFKGKNLIHMLVFEFVKVTVTIVESKD